MIVFIDFGYQERLKKPSTGDECHSPELAMRES